MHIFQVAMDTSSEPKKESSPVKRKSSQCEKVKNYDDDDSVDKYWYSEQVKEDMRRKGYIASSSWGSYVWVAQSFTARLDSKVRSHLPPALVLASQNTKLLHVGDEGNFTSIS